MKKILLIATNNINKLKEIKRKAENKLSFLEPKKQVIVLFVPLALSFLSVEIAAFLANHAFYINKVHVNTAIIPFILSIGIFLYVLRRIWGLSNVIVDVKKTSDEIQGKKDKEMRQTLLDISQKIVKGGEKYLTKVFVSINDKVIDKQKVEIEMITQEKKGLRICIENDEDGLCVEEISWYKSTGQKILTL